MTALDVLPEPRLFARTAGRAIDSARLRPDRWRVVMIRVRQSKGVQQGIAAVVFAAYLLVLAMAASPALHEWLHDDADEADHQCAVVTAILGQVDRPVVADVIVASPTLSWIEPRPALYAITIDRLFLLVGVFEHAPPH